MEFLVFQINDSNNLLKIFCCLIVIVFIIIAIGHYAFNNGYLTCNHYILNTYLYIVLSIAIIFIVVLLNDRWGIANSFLNLLFSIPIIGFIILLAIIFGLTYALHSVNPSNIVVSNFIWLTLIIVTGIIMVPIIMFGRLTNVVGLAGLLTICIVLVTGLLGYYLGDKIITFDWDYYLNIAVWILIIAYLGVYFVSDIWKYLYILAIVSLVIFVLLLLSNHKKLKDNAENCIDGQVIPNYPVESYSLIIKLVNVMSSLIRILGGRKK
uniref:Uncharacterized protein n=1 Tax=viral metagenome TaxID=1070528 RepID=A0A6C0HLS0_9ZZZZ